MSKSKKGIQNYRVAVKNLHLKCYPKCMHAYQIWIALFLQLSDKQQNYHLDLAFKQNIDIPLITTNTLEFTIQALSEVMALLCSGLHHSIHGLDIIAHWLNEQYLAAHLQEVFGQEVLTINHLRELSGLSKSQSPVSSISNYAGPLSLEKILAGISS